jgi:serine---pyruvate transaminase
VHVETSRGTTNPIDEIGRMLQAEFPHVLYMVDSVSGLGAADVRVDDWGIDFCCTSGQKAVNAPQGTAIVSVSSKGWQAIDTRKTPIYSLCLDLTVWRNYHRSTVWAESHWEDDSGTLDAALSQSKAAHGPSQSYVLMKGLKAALDEIFAEGPDSVIARHRVASCALREGMRAMGFATLASEQNAAPDATCVLIPGETFDVRRFMRTLWNEHGIASAGGSADRTGEYVGFRIGCMGQAATPQYILTALASIEVVLAQMGYPVRRGCAVPAAQNVFAQGA